MGSSEILIKISTYLEKSDQKRMFNISYLFLQSIYYSLRFKNTFRNIKAKYKYEYDLDAITSDLIYSRILNPSSKLSSYDYAQSFIEPPKYKLLCNDQSQVVFQRYLERASNSIFRALATLLFAHQDESLRRSMVSALSPTV